MIRKTTAVLLIALLPIGAFASQAEADEGMWLFEKPPVAQLKERYGLAPTPQWLEHVRKSCVRFSTWGSASLVSANGLVLTNHHVGAGALRNLSTADHNLLDTGFCAKSLAEELPCPRLDMYILWETDDVTDRVYASIAPSMTPAQAREAKQQAISAITESPDPDGLHREVVTLYRGARYHLYRYKRFSDIRLVMAPESQIAAFGGDHDNFEYPRYALDFCLFRIYQDGKPYRPSHHFTWAKHDPEDGDLVFVAGHPRTTHRNYTVQHLRFLRDVLMPAELNLRCRREVQLLNFSARSAAHARAGLGELKGVQNRRKALSGAYTGLLDTGIIKAKIIEEVELRRWVTADPLRNADWGDAWAVIESAQRSYKDFASLHMATTGWLSPFRTELFSRAQSIVRLMENMKKPNEQRRPEYQQSNLNTHLAWLYDNKPPETVYEIDRLCSGLLLLGELLGGDHPLVRAALAGQGPRARAESMVRGTGLHEVEFRKQLVQGQEAAIAASTDPMIAFAREIDPHLLAVERRYMDEVASLEEDGYAKLAAARFAKYGDSIYPDATNTLRLAFGVVRGYQQHDQTIPARTTFAGLYERHEERGGTPPFDLPQRWLDQKREIDLSVPVNFVATVDITGGNSGSPVIDRNGQLVGVVFDGNIQSLVWDYTFTDEQARCVVVDRRAIVEMLQKVCHAPALAAELKSE